MCTMQSMHERNDQMLNLKIWFDNLWPYFLQELPKICNPTQMFCLSIAKSESYYFDLQNLRHELRTQFLAIVPMSQTMRVAIKYRDHHDSVNSQRFKKGLAAVGLQFR